MTQPDHDLTRLVREDPLHPTLPDTTRIIRAGTRLRRRRQAVVTAGACLAAAAVVAPFFLLGGTGAASDLAPADQPVASTSASNTPQASEKKSLKRVANPPQSLSRLAGEDPQICGVAVCSVKRGAYGSVEEGELIGTSLDMGTFDGLTEVLYAARNEGFDTATGEPKASVDVISTGVVVDGQLRRTVWAFQPHEDPKHGPLVVYGGDRTLSLDGEAHFGVFGFVLGEHTEVTATIDGETRPVSGLSTTVLPGYTVFYDTAAWNESWSDRPQITYAVPAGASCSIEQCGTRG